ncbi:MAG: response regulator [Solirubrobacterales bacterium]|nr:response regulator [Solirubrobacterales bacterium]
MSSSLLIVDDDPFIRKLIATTLEDTSGFELVEAADGVEALERASAQPPALVLLDIDMPRLDGINACRRLRASEHGEAMTIVMLTAANSDNTQQRARAAGADLFLTKPFSPLDLLQLVDDVAADRVRTAAGDN